MATGTWGSNLSFKRHRVNAPTATADIPVLKQSKDVFFTGCTGLVNQSHQNIHKYAVGERNVHYSGY